MGEPITASELRFLRETDKELRNGETQQGIARKNRVVIGTVAHRLSRHGLRVRTISWLEDRRTGKQLDELLDEGILVEVPDSSQVRRGPKLEFRGDAGAMLAGARRR